MLTGDKLETAVNIGYSCGLMRRSTLTSIISKDSTLNEILLTLHLLEHGDDDEGEEAEQEKALIMDSEALARCLEDPSISANLMTATQLCRTVIACRLSPDQKAALVELLQTKVQGAVCLAIGDGANDVGMIQAARIGVGISGKEGQQAVCSADFALAQFRFLQRLLLVHGSWAYHRISKAALFCIYKNILLYACQFWVRPSHSCTNLFSLHFVICFLDRLSMKAG